MTAHLPRPTIVHATGSGIPVVLLHCLGVDHHIWDSVVLDLQPGFQTITYDLPGHGASPSPDAEYSMWDLADQLAEVLDQQNIASAHVVGMSLGGCVAQAFAARYPARVNCLVLADTTPRYPEALRTTWAERAAIARRSGVSALAREIMVIWFTPEFSAAAGPAVRYVQQTLTACDAEGYARACEALAATDLLPSARTIKARTLIALGDGDLPPFHDAARWLSHEIPGSEIWLIPNARHAAPLEQGKLFAARLRNFFEAV